MVACRLESVVTSTKRAELLLPESRLLPFWIHDVSATAHRIPGGEATAHPNGARGIASLVVAMPGVAMASLTFGDVFGVSPSLGPDGVTTLGLGALRVDCLESEPAGIRRVRLTGIPDLPQGIRDLGVEPSPPAR